MHVKPVYVKPVHVEPVYIEPVKYCFFKVFYKQPCWDYQKELRGYPRIHFWEGEAPAEPGG